MEAACRSKQEGRQKEPLEHFQALDIPGIFLPPERLPARPTALRPQKRNAPLAAVYSIVCFDLKYVEERASVSPGSGSSETVERIDRQLTYVRPPPQYPAAAAREIAVVRDRQETGAARRITLRINSNMPSPIACQSAVTAATPGGTLAIDPRREEFACRD